MTRASLLFTTMTVAVLAGCSDDPSSPVYPDRSVDAQPSTDARDEATPLPEAEPPEAAAEAEAAPPVEAGPYPQVLSETGLYADLVTGELARGVRAFQPKYALWSDGATKKRWVYFPPSSTIDTTDMDFWKYPVGTKVWKEFSRGDRLETRMLHKAGPKKSDWVMIAYAWRADGTDAEAVPDGVQNAGGTDHDIPSQADCSKCHDSMPDVLLGVTAIQLSHDLPGMKLRTLVSEERLTQNPPGEYALIPGDAVAETALGYLHANCGACHNAKSGVHATIALELWERVASCTAVEQTVAYQTAVGQPNVYSSLLTIDPGRPGRSALLERISQRGPNQMPPLGTEHVDDDGVAAVTAWIASLPPLPDDGGTEGGDAGAADSGAVDAGDGG